MCNVERMECSKRTDFQSRNSVNGVVHGASWTGKMKNIIHFPAVKRLINVGLPKFKTCFVAKIMEIGLPSGQEVIHRNYGVAFCQ